MLDLIQQHNIEQTVKRCLELGPGNAIRETERQKGFSVIEVGTRPWFKKSDWTDGILSTDGRIVRIVSILAKKPRNGAFKRMVKGIKADGLVPMVVCPFDEMTVIMQKWGWRETIIDGDFHETEEQWTEE